MMTVTRPSEPIAEAEMVLSIDPAHGGRALNYERAMRSRNRLLSEGRPDPAWLDGLEAQMAELGTAIVLEQHRTLRARYGGARS